MSALSDGDGDGDDIEDDNDDNEQPSRRLVQDTDVWLLNEVHELQNQQELAQKQHELTLLAAHSGRIVGRGCCGTLRSNNAQSLDVCVCHGYRMLVTLTHQQRILGVKHK